MRSLVAFAIALLVSVSVSNVAANEVDVNADGSVSDSGPRTLTVVNQVCMRIL
jgi:hypothetical protein